MDSLNSSSGNRCSLRYRRHHHHFLYVSPHCPFHRSILHPINHLPSCSFSTSHPFPLNPYPVASIPTDVHSSLHDSQFNKAYDDTKIVQDDTRKLETEEEEEELIFVLTDEWRDFFAKSEAKRKLAKKQAKNKGKS